MRPCLVVGLGGLGIRAMLESHRRYVQLPPEGRCPASFLGVGLESDTVSSELEEVLVLASTELRQAVIHLDLEIDGRLAWERVLDWFPDPNRFEMEPQRPDGTGGSRPLGRLALWAGRHPDLVRGNIVRRLNELMGYAASLYDRRVDVLFLASSWGGTGSALPFDMANVCRRLGRLGRQDLLLALPSTGELAGFQNAFSTLLDLAVARRQSTSLLGGPNSTSGPPNPATAPRPDRRPLDLEPLVTTAPNGIDSLAEIALARLSAPLVPTLDNWRQRVTRVCFGARPLTTSPRLHSAAASSLRLLRLEANTTELEATLEIIREEEEESTPLAIDAMDLEELTPAPDSENEHAHLTRKARKVLRRFLRRIEVLLPEVLESLKKWSRAQEKTQAPGEAPRAERPDPFSPLFSSFEEAARPERLQALLDKLGCVGVYSDLEETTDSTAQELVMLPRSVAEKTIGEFEEKSLRRLPRNQTSASRLQELEACSAEMVRFSTKLNNAPWYRRFPLPDNLLRRNDEICRGIEAEAIELRDWSQALHPLLEIAALRLLVEQLSQEPLSPSPQSTSSTSLMENADEVAIAEAELRALRVVLPPVNDGDDFSKCLQTLEEKRDRKGGWWLPDPEAPGLPELLADCRPDAFVTRSAGSYPRTLFLLIPEGLLWPDGIEALENTTRQIAARDLAARVEVVQGATDRVVFYVEERDQPLVNLEAIDRLRRCYMEHPHRSTLHIDRHWAESAEMATLVEELGIVEDTSVRPLASDFHEALDETAH